MKWALALELYLPLFFMRGFIRALTQEEDKELEISIYTKTVKEIGKMVKK